MSSFVAIIYQPGGCDYTVGCGYLPVFVTADSREEAFEKLKEKEGWSEYEECGVDPEGWHPMNNYSVKLMEVDNSSSTDYSTWLERMHEKHHQAQAEAAEKKDIEDYARLKEKLGKE